MPATTFQVFGSIALLFLVPLAVAPSASGQERAAPPTWTDADIEPFFPDAREALVGERPAPASTGGAERATATPETQGHAFRWSETIDAEALDTEVKRVAARLAAPLANPAVFKSGGHSACQAEFAMLAVLFAVIDDYDGDVRWQRDAAALRDAFAKTSANCRVATDASYVEATRRRDELAEIIRGARLGGAEPGPLEKWSALADRKLLMQRMERAVQEGVNPRLANEREFESAAADVRQEAQLLALLAEVIHRDNYEYWDDETFREYAQELGGAAADLSQAAAEGNYDSARAAAGRASQSCAACHDGYRL